MSVEIKIFSSLRHHVSSSEKRLEGDKWDMPEGSTLNQVLKCLAAELTHERRKFSNGFT
jgi:hypothetical protein